MKTFERRWLAGNFVLMLVGLAAAWTGRILYPSDSPLPSWWALVAVTLGASYAGLLRRLTGCGRPIAWSALGTGAVLAFALLFLGNGWQDPPDSPIFSVRVTSVLDEPLGLQRIEYMPPWAFVYEEAIVASSIRFEPGREAGVRMHRGRFGLIWREFTQATPRRSHPAAPLHDHDHDHDL